MQDNGGMFIPSCISPVKNVFLSIYNTDYQIDTPDSQQKLNATAMAIFQEVEAEVQQQKVKFEICERNLIKLHCIHPYFVQT